MDLAEGGVRQRPGIDQRQLVEGYTGPWVGRQHFGFELNAAPKRRREELCAGLDVFLAQDAPAIAGLEGSLDGAAERLDQLFVTVLGCFLAVFVEMAIFFEDLATGAAAQQELRSGWLFSVPLDLVDIPV